MSLPALDDPARRSAVAQKCLGRVRIERSRDPETLSDVTLQLAHDVHLRLRLDTLGDDVQVQQMCEANDGPHDLALRSGQMYALQKAAINLHAVHRQLTQVRE